MYKSVNKSWLLYYKHTPRSDCSSSAPSWLPQPKPSLSLQSTRITWQSSLRSAARVILLKSKSVHVPLLLKALPHRPLTLYHSNHAGLFAITQTCQAYSHFTIYFLFYLKCICPDMTKAVPLLLHLGVLGDAIRGHSKIAASFFLYPLDTIFFFIALALFVSILH